VTHTRLLVWATALGAAACAHHTSRVAPAETHAGCYVLEWSDGASPAPGFFPDTLGLAPEWFLPGDSTGERLRVVRPRDASLATYRTYGGRFWWFDSPDSVTVVKSDGERGVRLEARMALDGFTGTVHRFGDDSGDDIARSVAGRRISCP
jgi:hypothetical protein